DQATAAGGKASGPFRGPGSASAPGFLRGAQGGRYVHAEALFGEGGAQGDQACPDGRAGRVRAVVIDADHLAGEGAAARGEGEGRVRGECAGDQVRGHGAVGGAEGRGD